MAKVDEVRDALIEVDKILPSKVSSKYKVLLDGLGYTIITSDLDKVFINDIEMTELFRAKIRIEFRDLGYDGHLDAIFDYIMATAFDNPKK